MIYFVMWFLGLIHRMWLAITPPKVQVPLPPPTVLELDNPGPLELDVQAVREATEVRSEQTPTDEAIDDLEAYLAEIGARQ